MQSTLLNSCKFKNYYLNWTVIKVIGKVHYSKKKKTKGRKEKNRTICTYYYTLFTCCERKLYEIELIKTENKKN